MLLKCNFWRAMDVEANLFQLGSVSIYRRTQSVSQFFQLVTRCAHTLSPLHARPNSTNQESSTLGGLEVRGERRNSH